MTGIFVPWSNNPNSPGWIEDGAGCHIWVGASLGGYGQARNPVTGKTGFVHRIRYEREIGPIPEGMGLDHFACDNGAGGCCNPRHCRPTTQRENVLRGDTVPARNAAKTHCPRGHELVEGNLVASVAKSGGRKCRLCVNERQNERYRNNKRAAL